MKKFILFFLAGIAFNSCSDQKSESKDVVKDSTSVEPAAVKMNYPYTIDHPDNWDMGSAENTMVALSGLKAYENGNIDDCVKYFGDSVRLEFDGLDTKVSRDSLKAMFTKSRAGLKSMQVKMDDWESVISKDKSEEYVSIWYKEIWEDTKGKKDSLAQMDDLRMKNGKIIGIDQKSRKLPAKKM
ncbi:MAG: hypothetical protein ABI834_04295 [Ginsengibacter sp.]